MPRRNRRKTNRQPQAERRLRVRGVRRATPDAKRLSRAFIGLALARAEAEAQAQTEAALDFNKGKKPGRAGGENENGAS